MGFNVVLRVAFLCLVWALIMKFQMDYEQDLTATRHLKNTLEIAVHDGSMMISPDELSKGSIIFDRYMAEGAFILAFERNTGMRYSGDSFLPEPSNSQVFFKHPVDVVHMELIDELSQPGITFPCVYGISCGNPEYEIFETIYGPSMVVVAETLSPRFFSDEPQVIRQSAVYEYKNQY